jgi:hypothetical protein
LEGYPADAELPDYRTGVPAFEEWHTDDAVTQLPGLRGRFYRDRQSVKVDVREDIAVIQARARMSSPQLGGRC